MRFLVIVILSLALAPSLHYELLRVEDRRQPDAAALLDALDHRESAVRAQATRALGRLERPAHTDALEGRLRDPAPEVRVEAANALGQMGHGSAFASALAHDSNPRVRGALYEALGRVETEGPSVLLSGLSEEEPARLGAARGLEHWARRQHASSDAASLPSDDAEVISQAVRADGSSLLSKRLLMTALNHLDAGRHTAAYARQHDDAQLRRLGVMATKQWMEDPSYLVRVEALRQDFTCERAEFALGDNSQHVVLTAIDLMAQACSPSRLAELVEEHHDKDWRVAAHALVSLAKRESARALPFIRRLADHPVWQMRAWVARASSEAGDSETLERLRDRGQHANVIAAALTAETAIQFLDHEHYGLLVRALNLLKDSEIPPDELASLLVPLKRLTAQRRHTSRDPRMAILEILSDQAPPSILVELAGWTSDFDSVVASRAAELASRARGETVSASVVPIAAETFISPATLESLDRATAQIEMEGLGDFRLEFYPSEAPLTVAQFVKLSESGYYNGLTFHRIVSNFVLQGGSPGANEFVGTDGYIRDEVGHRIHERGTLGISTRGRDTGDSQIFVNLVDNYRLDHNYTVFARVIDGMDVVDQIQEGDVMETIEIIYR